MQGTQHTLSLLEELRSGILSGRRIELPSAQRQHLEKGSPLIGELSYDVRHRPVSTNVSRHFAHLRTLAAGVEVRQHDFLQLKKDSAPPPSQKASAAQGTLPSALLVALTADSRLSVFDLEGEALLEGFDLGHAPGTKVKQMVLSPSQESHFVLTAADDGEMRVHALKVVVKKRGTSNDDDAAAGELGEDVVDESKTKKKKQLIVSSNFSCSFSIPASDSGEVRSLNTVMPVERGVQTYFVTGDSLGGIGVFYRNGTLKGRARVTEDPGGVRGVMRSQGQGQMVLYHSSHSFGFFSITQMDVQYPPCAGWNSPLVDMVPDPTFASSRVVLALADGDILVFSTTRAKSKACDLTLKFPHVSPVPFKLHAFRGHMLGLPTPPPEMEREVTYPREVFFFNIAAMEAGYGVGPSRAVALQASFQPKQPESLSLLAGGSSAKPLVSMKFAGMPGVELHELTLKQPPAPKQAVVEEGVETSWTSNWTSWFPKFGVFGVALVGVVIWNVRKAANQRQGDLNMDFDDEYLEQLKAQAMRHTQKGAASGGGSAASGPIVEEIDEDD